jgi:hypothetical protein
VWWYLQLSPLMQPEGLLKNLHLCVSGGCCGSVVISGGVCGCGMFSVYNSCSGFCSSRAAGGAEGCRGRLLGNSMVLRGATWIFSVVYDWYLLDVCWSFCSCCFCCFSSSAVSFSSSQNAATCIPCVQPA